MSYHVVKRWGDSVDEPNEQQMREALRELDMEDTEHPDCWLTRDDGLTLSVSEGGRVCYDDLSGSAKPRHINGVSREKALEMWRQLIAGDFAALEREPWQSGSHVPLTEEELRAHNEEVARAVLARDREWYDSLGPEDPSRPCRREGCNRGSVRFSVFCRPHHFGENCPFTH
jgi:hypothetical protein